MNTIPYNPNFEGALQKDLSHPTKATKHIDVEAVVKEFEEKMELYDAGIGLEVGLYDWFRDVLTTQATQHEESLREVYREILGIESTWEEDEHFEIMKKVNEIFTHLESELTV